jgi:hypothetical protein
MSDLEDTTRPTLEPNRSAGAYIDQIPGDGDRNFEGFSARELSDDHQRLAQTLSLARRTTHATASQMICGAGAKVVRTSAFPALTRRPSWSGERVREHGNCG